MSGVLLVELNELNFDMVERYAAAGRLPTLGGLIRRHGYALTTSETAYEQIEPWIQWVSAHTGKTLAEHGVFRLGDIVDQDHEQIWEVLERHGLQVGAFSPMNAKNRMKQPAFFVPDPWTQTKIAAPPLVERLHAAIAQVVNDNAEARITPSSAVFLALGAMRYAAPSNYGAYLRLAAGAFMGKPWLKAVFLDLLLADVFQALCRRKRVDFASIFLNAAAHIQHHYLHSSTVSEVEARNPDWYCAPGADPILDVYEAYDRVVRRLIAAFPSHRVMIATGLHQVSHEAATFYWRLKDPAAFMARLDIVPRQVRPLMSRDFVLEFDGEAQASDAARRLRAVTAPDGPVFEVDDRGLSLFVAFAYPHDIGPDLRLQAGNLSLDNLRQEVAFVAIKNGEHDGVGYLLDTGGAPGAADKPIPLTGLPALILDALAPQRALASAE